MPHSEQNEQVRGNAAAAAAGAVAGVRGNAAAAAAGAVAGIVAEVVMEEEEQPAMVVWPVLDW